MSYGPDRWLYPIEITADNNGIHFDDNGFDLTTTIGVGTYYAHDDVSINSTYPSLYAAVRAAMVAESLSNGDTSTFTMAAATPTSSTGVIMGGLAITTDVGRSMLWYADGTINKTGALGYIYNGADSPETETVTSPYSIAGAWDPPEYATDLRGIPNTVLDYSTEYTERADFYVLNRGDRTLRTAIYEYIPSAHVYTSRADDADYAAAGGLGLGDTHNAFERLWAWYKLGSDIIVVHRNATQSLNLLVTSQGYEVVRCTSIEAARDMSSIADMQLTAGEWYRLTIPCVVKTAGDYSGQ